DQRCAGGADQGDAGELISCCRASDSTATSRPSGRHRVDAIARWRPTRTPTVTDDRLGALEARLAKIEAFVGLPAAPAEPSPPAAVAAVLPARDWMPNPATRPSVPSVPPVPRPPQVPAPASRPRSFADLEEQLSSRLLAWVGGVALVLGAMFFLSLAFSRGWIGPEARVIIGLVAGAAAFAASVWLFERGNRTPPATCTGSSRWKRRCSGSLPSPSPPPQSRSTTDRRRSRRSVWSRRPSPHPSSMPSPRW